MKIRNQVYLINVFTSIIPLLLLALLSTITLQHELKKAEDKRIEVIFQREEKNIENIFLDIKSQINILTDIYNVSETDNFNTYLRSFSQSSDNVEYFAFIDHRGIIYNGAKSPVVFPKDFNFEERPWYKGALESDDFFLSPIFIHGSTKKPSLTLSKKVYKGGKFQGIIGVLLNIESIKESLDTNSLSSTFYIIDDRGKFILGSKRGKELNTQYTNNIITANWKDRFTLEKSKKRLFFEGRKVPDTNLIIIGCIDENELIKPVLAFKKNLMFIIFSTVIISIILTIIFGRRFSSSLIRLANIIDNIARGNYNKNLSKLTNFIDIDNELYLVKESIKRLQDEIRDREAKLKMISETDPLTQIFNRGAIMEFIEMELQRSSNFGTEFSLIMFDLDHFKGLNDNYGHHFGDEVLKEISSSVSSSIKNTDIFGRYGGEEFLLLLSDTPQEEAVVTANLIREIISNLKWKHDIVVTASFGVTHCCGHIDDISTLFTSVDGLLYRAKKNGRNRVEYMGNG